MLRILSAHLALALLLLPAMTACGSTAASTAASAAAEAPVAPTWLAPSTRITWGVEYQGATYDLMATLRDTSADLTFDWIMTPPASSQGQRTLLAADRAGSDKQINQFQSGEVGAKEGTMTIWFSKRMHMELKATGATQATIDGAARTLKRVGEGGRNLTIAGVGVRLPTLKIEGGDGFVWEVLDNAEAPMILEQEVGFHVWIKSIEPPSAAH